MSSLYTHYLKSLWLHSVPNLYIARHIDGSIASLIFAILPYYHEVNPSIVWQVRH